MTDTLSTIPLTRINGAGDSLGNHAGKVLLVVNVASKCGLTPQYEALEKLYETYRDQRARGSGLSRQRFRRTGTRFCRRNHRVLQTELWRDISAVRQGSGIGHGQAAALCALIAARPTKQGPAADFRELLKGHGMTPNEDPEVLWNFEKFLIARDGTVVGRFAPNTAPSDPLLTGAILSELAK